MLSDINFPHPWIPYLFKPWVINMRRTIHKIEETLWKIYSLKEAGHLATQKLHEIHTQWNICTKPYRVTCIHKPIPSDMHAQKHRAILITECFNQTHLQIKVFVLYELIKNTKQKSSRILFYFLLQNFLLFNFMANKMK